MNSARQVHNLPPLPRRLADSHKGTYGRVLLVAGSCGMLGAAALAARAALRTGSGLVTCAVPRSLSPALAAMVPEATQLLLPEPDSADYRRDLEAALSGSLAERFDGLGIGPGLSTRRSSRDLLRAMLNAFTGPQLLDADALNLVADGVQLPPSSRRVWTPHPGEFRRLTGEMPRGDEERIRAAEAFVDRYGGVLLLKGNRTVVHDGSRCFINLTGNAAMATGGSGDVLTGMLASLLGQGLEPFDAACLAAHLHGLAGDIAARELGPASVIAGDIIEHLPAALLDYHRGRSST